MSALSFAELQTLTHQADFDEAVRARYGDGVKVTVTRNVVNGYDEIHIAYDGRVRTVRVDTMHLFLTKQGALANVQAKMDAAEHELWHASIPT